MEEEEIIEVQESPYSILDSQVPDSQDPADAAGQANALQHMSDPVFEFWLKQETADQVLRRTADSAGASSTQ